RGGHVLDSRLTPLRAILAGLDRERGHRMFHRMAFFVAALALCVASAVRSVPAADATAQADTLYAHKDWKAAARAYEAITKATPQSPRPWYRLGVCYGNLAQWPKAI